MSVSIISHNSDFGTTGQIFQEDIPEIVAAGYQTVIDNRPDFEGGLDQPQHTDIEEAVKSAGLTFAYLPVISGQITLAQVQQMAELLDTLPKPILAFCRSGARSTNLYQLALQLG
ncbi:beta-lactamase hydrolase domain-containing protein [Polynucleobacter kasalickyi]|uniref:TIGR01244 family protein n=1 Tax=Polynucleobacter kasalickyi TaxID=1938817 RepID=A0A1W1ZEH8_9BURK|nr:sulfur transferase domain-containing protein [Polynucleobacter kasalickyi]SMC46428.1 TIGR01244 family protein [Polynucleobacter kasalickyi]